jgi:hypothetical protein
MSPKKLTDGRKPRQARDYDEKMQIVQRALNRKETGETIEDISKDTGASEAIVYMLVKRFKSGQPLDKRKGHQPIQKDVEEAAPIDKAEAEQRSFAHLMPTYGKSRHAFKAEIRVDHRDEDEGLTLAEQNAVLRHRVRQLESLVRAFTDAALLN